MMEVEVSLHEQMIQKHDDLSEKYAKNAVKILLLCAEVDDSYK